MRYFLDGADSCRKEHQEKFDNVSQMPIPRIGEIVLLPDYENSSNVNERLYQVDMVTYNPPYDGSYLYLIDIECHDVTDKTMSKIEEKYKV